MELKSGQPNLDPSQEIPDQNVETPVPAPRDLTEQEKIELRELILAARASSDQIPGELDSTATTKKGGGTAKPELTLKEISNKSLASGTFSMAEKLADVLHAAKGIHDNPKTPSQVLGDMRKLGIVKEGPAATDTTGGETTDSKIIGGVAPKTDAEKLQSEKIELIRIGTKKRTGEQNSRLAEIDNLLRPVKQKTVKARPPAAPHVNKKIESKSDWGEKDLALEAALKKWREEKDPEKKREAEQNFENLKYDGNVPKKSGSKEKLGKRTSEPKLVAGDGKLVGTGAGQVVAEKILAQPVAIAGQAIEQSAGKKPHITARELKAVIERTRAQKTGKVEVKDGVDKSGWTEIDHELERLVGHLSKTRSEKVKRRIEREIDILKDRKFGKINGVSPKVAAQIIENGSTDDLLGKAVPEDIAEFNRRQAAKANVVINSKPEPADREIPSQYEAALARYPNAGPGKDGGDKTSAEKIKTEKDTATDTLEHKRRQNTPEMVDIVNGKILSKNLTPAQMEKIAAKNKETRERALKNLGADRTGRIDPKFEKEMENLSPEERERAGKMARALEEQATKTKVEAEKKGFIGTIRNIGEWFKSKPPKTRLAIGLSLSALALGAGAAGLTAGVAGYAIGAGTFGWRFLGGSAMFAGVESSLMKREVERAKKEGKEITDARKKALTAGAFVFSATFGVLFGQAVQNVMSGEALDAFKNIFGMSGEEAGGVAGVKGPGGAATASAAAEAKEVLLANYPVEKGDRLYDIIKKIPGMDSLDGGRQTNAIENILAKIKEDPEAFGINSGNVNELTVGDKIDLEKIRGILKNTMIGDEHIIEHAQKLSDEARAHIESYVPGADEAASAGTPTGTTGGIPASGAEMTGEKVDLNKEEGTGINKDTGETGKKPDASTPDTDQNKTSIENLRDLDGRTANLLSDTRTAMTANLDQTFGQKGLFGVGEIHGADSEIWKEWRGKSIFDAMQQKQPSADMLKLRGFLEKLSRDSGISPNPGQQIERFVIRATAELIKRKGLSVA